MPMTAATIISEAALSATRRTGYVNAGRTHVFFCREHKKSRIAGSNLFSSWREETEEQQKQLWDEVGLDGFERVTPYGGGL